MSHFKHWLLLSLHNKIIIPNCITIFYVDTSVETPLSLTSTTFPESTSFTLNPFLSDSIIIPTPNVPHGKLNTINEMKPFINEYRFMSIT